MLLKVLFFAILLWLIFRAARNLLTSATRGIPSREQRMDSGYVPGSRRRVPRTPAESRNPRAENRDATTPDIEDAVWEDLP
ncbi:MAG: hypothetical protein KJO98_09995 [Rhodothermia bacterium]|nr:hypothetical protein [Rhodothermia bacterium]